MHFNTTKSFRYSQITSRIEILIISFSKQNYGVSNNAYALVEKTLYSTEAEYLRLKCVMNNALLEENTSKYDSLKAQFNITV